MALVGVETKVPLIRIQTLIELYALSIVNYPDGTLAFVRSEDAYYVLRRGGDVVWTLQFTVPT